MTHFDVTAALSCFPGVGPFFGTMNMLSNMIERDDALEDLSKVVLFQLTEVMQRVSLNTASISNALQSRTVSILERGQLHSIYAIIGNSSTAAVSIAFISGVPSIMIVGSCAFLTLAQTYHWSENTSALRIMRSRL